MAKKIKTEDGYALRISNSEAVEIIFRLTQQLAGIGGGAMADIVVRNDSTSERVYIMVEDLPHS